MGRYLSQWGGTGEGVGNSAVAQTESRVRLDKGLVAAHVRRIGKEQEGACH